MNRSGAALESRSIVYLDGSWRRNGQGGEGQLGWVTLWECSGTGCWKAGFIDKIEDRVGQGLGFIHLRKLLQWIYSDNTGGATERIRRVDQESFVHVSIYFSQIAHSHVHLTLDTKLRTCTLLRNIIT